MTQLGIKPTTYQSQGGDSTTRLLSNKVSRLVLGFFSVVTQCFLAVNITLIESPSRSFLNGATFVRITMCGMSSRAQFCGFRPCETAKCFQSQTGLFCHRSSCFKFQSCHCHAKYTWRYTSWWNTISGGVLQIQSRDDTNQHDPGGRVFKSRDASQASFTTRTSTRRQAATGALITEK